jgi:hypothetical protein
MKTMKTLEILHGNKLRASVLKCDPQAFVNKVVEISIKLHINPHWLMLVMELETAGTFDPAITNKLGYTGLIQFGTAAASSIGTTTDRLRQMDGIAQLDYVYAYLKPYKNKMNRMTDVYLAVFFPAAIGKPDGWVLHTSRLSPERIANWNPLFDVNKDKRIQVWEIKQKLLARVPKQLKSIML